MERANQLHHMLHETDKRLQAALQVMRTMKEQACVKVTVKKEVGCVVIVMTLLQTHFLVALLRRRWPPHGAQPPPRPFTPASAKATKAPRSLCR